MQPELYSDMARLELSHFWFRARRVVMATCLRRNQSDIPHGKVLDAGCGVGANLEVLGHFGTVVGIELNHDACLYTVSKFPGQLAEGQLEKLPFLDNTFAIVALLDVLEHIDDQQAVLRELTRSMQHGGVLLISVPAFRHLWSGHDIVHHHRRRYRSGELRRELEAAGLKVIYLSYFNTLLYPLVAISRLMARHRSSPPNSQMQTLPNWLNTLFYAIFCCERLWLGRFSAPFGVSLVAIVKKC